MFDIGKRREQYKHQCSLLKTPQEVRLKALCVGQSEAQRDKPQFSHAEYCTCYRRSESLVLTRFDNDLSLVKALPRLERSLSTGAYRQLLALTRTGHPSVAAQRVLRTLGLGSETITALQPSLNVRLLDCLLSHRALNPADD